MDDDLDAYLLYLFGAPAFVELLAPDEPECATLIGGPYASVCGQAGARLGASSD